MIPSATQSGDGVGVRHLFAYGTLMQRECRQHYLRRHGAVFMQAARAPGLLLDLGAYPALLPPRQPDQWVMGELYELPRPDQSLPRLDAVEGSGFRRELIRAVAADGYTCLAWVYLWNGEADYPLIPSGDWRRR